ncbi:hypothetical protein DFJ58DRAFT_845163 [Suillus subalutaceus]|uniref:uncharacterized protein n=1 Tax=Suillus subalutaceus TaxID=48586 RepID=UPI001B873FA8|nr:uncharacterized protein DFJ58DRAFT_845163 [Suillus subalutaceus]KAG1841023.1 hypothetical protein DFJ58DRAFT_845163 [Suillus subalutaceus]
MSTSLMTDYIIGQTASIRSADLAVASAALIVYDHVITFDQEVDLFWTGRQDATKFFYLSYTVRKVLMARVISDSMSPQCTFMSSNLLFKALLTGHVVLVTLGVALCQGSTIALSDYLFDQYYEEIVDPSFTKSPMIFALLGLVVYACATGSLLYTIIALSFPNLSQLDVYYTGLQGGLVVAATLVSVCHALLGIRSISATLHVDPAWLLNHAELSRVQWTKGNSEGEIFVELDCSCATELPMTSLSHTVVPDTVSSSGSNFDDQGTPTKNYNIL